MLEFGFRAGMLGFATSSAESFVFGSYWFIFWHISERGQWWVSLAVSSPLPLLDSFVDQESFQGTGELRFFMEYLAHRSSALWVYPIKAEEYFRQDKHVEWWIIVLHDEMCVGVPDSIPVLNSIMCGQSHHCLRLIHSANTHTHTLWFTETEIVDDCLYLLHFYGLCLKFW